MCYFKASKLSVFVMLFSYFLEVAYLFLNSLYGFFGWTFMQVWSGIKECKRSDSVLFCILVFIMIFLKVITQILGEMPLILLYSLFPCVQNFII